MTYPTTTRCSEGSSSDGDNAELRVWQFQADPWARSDAVRKPCCLSAVLFLRATWTILFEPPGTTRGSTTIPASPPSPSRRPQSGTTSVCGTRTTVGPTRSVGDRSGRRSDRAGLGLGTPTHPRPRASAVVRGCGSWVGWPPSQGTVCPGGDRDWGCQVEIGPQRAGVGPLAGPQEAGAAPPPARTSRIS